jgi:glucokinase
MGFNICFDIGGTRIKSGLLKNNQLLSSKISEVKDNSLLAPVLIQLEKIIDQYCEEFSHLGKLEGIGIALPSLIDTKKNKILSHYVKYTDAAQIDLNHWATSNWQVPLVLHNDAKAALLGEIYEGAGKGYENVVMLTFGTGVGSGVFLNGKLLDGKNYIAGNLMGHSIINWDGVTCNCGQQGCLEATASTWALPQIISQLAKSQNKEDKEYKNLGFKEIIENTAQDPFLEQIKKTCLDVWGMLLVNMVLAYNPEVLICGGGIMNSHDIIFPHFKKILNQHGWINADYVQLKRAAQPEFAAIYGLNQALKL